MVHGGVEVHKYLFLAALILFILFVIYVYVCNHKVDVSSNLLWTEAFTGVGISAAMIDLATHDDSMWYYEGYPTCVAYGGDFSRKCLPHEHYCSGGSVYGTPDQQASAIKDALQNGGEHPQCPLIYPGVN